MKGNMNKNITMRADNKGLTVAINFWSMEKELDQFSADRAKHRIKGQAKNVGTGETKKFNTAGELLCLLSKWNVAQFKKLKANENPASMQPTTHFSACCLGGGEV
jgi:hypothetical protein